MSGIFIPIDFMERPTNFFLYQNLKKEFLKLHCAESGELDDNLGYKIDSSYSRAVFEIISSRMEYYNSLVEALNIPASPAAEMSLSWTAYRSKLNYEFNVRPLFGQEESKISVSQLYVPLRGLWYDEDSVDNSSYNSDDGIGADANFVIIEEYLYDWAVKGDSGDWLRLIGGGPGSGKSTTLKSFASRLSSLESIRPLFVPLQHIGLDRDLRDSINSHFVESTDNPFTQPPLSRSSVEDGPPLLLIFDGLDELVAPGEAAKDVVGTFANRLNSLVSALSGNGARTVKVVVSGRMPAFQAATRYLTPPSHGVIEAYGFLPLDLELDDEMEARDDALKGIDQRPIWWGNYARLTGEQKEVPEAFSNERLSGITHEPLLCYLLVLAGYATDHWELAAENRNRIYAALIDSVYERGWGDGATKRLGPGRALSKQDFNKLMESIALAAWLGGDARVASEEKFEEAIDILGSRKAWEAFCSDNGNDVTNLAMNFYFKSSEKSQRGFEFTHKSFGEYLASRALISVAREVSTQCVRRPDFALLDWFRATRTGVLTSEMHLFLIDEIELSVMDGNSETVSDINRLKSEFEKLAKIVADDGFSIPSTSSTWRSVEIEQAIAECCIWAMINSCSISLAKNVSHEASMIKIEWSSESDLCNILLRLGRFESTEIIYELLANLDADSQTISGIRASHINFTGASLDSSLFVGCHIHSGSFEGAVLNQSRFYACHIERTSFRSASMSNVILHVCRMRRCNFQDCDTEQLIITPLSFVSAIETDFDHLKGAIRIMMTDGMSLDRAIDQIKERVELLGQLEWVERNGFVGDV